MEKGISIVICCYNSGWILERTLYALKGQQIPDGLGWEIVLVDNCCTDDTVEVAKKALHDSHIDYQIVSERNPGLANARRKGIDVVKYSYVIYCDDDNLLCEDYVATMYGMIHADPQLGAVGGRGIPEFCADPDPIILNYLSSYAVGSQKDFGDWLYGAGVCLRTELVRNIYATQKSYLMGRKGNMLLSGDDQELILSIQIRGYRIMAIDEITFVHVLRANRLTHDYFKKMWHGMQMALPVIEAIRLVKDGKPFSELKKNYWLDFKIWLKYRVMFWKKDAARIRGYKWDYVVAYRFWGLRQLKRIYLEYLALKNEQRA